MRRVPSQPSSRAWRRCAPWAIALVVGSLSTQAAAIVNGTTVADARFASEFPWMVTLEYPIYAGICTGVLISPTWVLSAGHCSGDPHVVRVGHAERARARRVTVRSSIRHPRYDQASGSWDIGLVQLSEPVALAPVRTAIDTGDLVRAEARALIAGWGRRSTAPGYAGRLVVSDVVLGRLLREPSRYAYEDRASGPCGGDSGGPMLLRDAAGAWVLAGIASRVVGSICADGGGVGIYSDVGAAADFIRRHVTDLPRPL